MLSEKRLTGFIVAGLYAVLFTPLVFHQSFIFPFIIPKVFVFQALVGVVAALWAVLAMRYPAYRPERNAVGLALAAFLLALGVSAFFGVDTARSFWSIQERGIGVVALLHFGALSLVLTAMRERISWRAYFAVSILVSAIAGAFAFVQLSHPQLFFEGALWGKRPGSFLGNPTFLASYLLFHVFLGLWLAAERIRDGSNRSSLWLGALFGAAAVFEGVVIFFTQTRGAIFGLASGVFALVVYAAWRGGSTQLTTSGRAPLVGRLTLRHAGAAALALLLLGTAAFWMTREAALWQKIPGLNRLTNLERAIADIGPRLVALRISADAFRERPLFGFGSENFKYAFDARYDPKLLRYGFAETYFDKPHNMPVEYAVTTGFVGLLAYLALFAAMLRGLFRHPELAFFRPFGLAVVASYFVQNLFVFDTFGSYLMLFVVAAFIASTDPRGKRVHAEEGTRVPGKLFRTTVTVGATLIALASVGMNASVLYANNRQYWILNYFLNRRSDLAISSFNSAIAAPVRPYASEARRDFASALSQVYLQTVPIPDLVQTIAHAMAELEKAIGAKPRDYYLRLTYADVATVFAATDRTYLIRGEEHLREAMRLSPRRQQNYFTFAKIRILQGKTGEALDLVRQAIELDPEIGDSHFYYALIAFEAGDEQAGLRELDEAGRLGRVPRTGHEARVVANHFGDAGRYDEAIRWYAFAVHEDPEDLEALLKLGLVNYYVGRLDEAKKRMQEVADRTDLRHAPSYSLLKPILDELGIVVAPTPTRE